jgi:hypothetical protein
MVLSSHPFGLRKVVEHPANDPTLSRFPADIRLRFEVLGYNLRIETNHPNVERAARESFGPALPEHGEPELTVRILVHHVPEEPNWRPGQPLIREQLGLYTATSSRATNLVAALDLGVAMGFVSEQAASHAEFLRFAIVQSAAFGLVTHRSLAAVHSACIWRDGTMLMLRGIPGAGKSTLAYAALRRGFSMIAEDVVYAREESGRMMCYGLPWIMYMLPDAARFFPELEGQLTVERANGERKIGLAVDEWFPGQVRTSAEVGPIIFVARSADDGHRIVPLEPEAALPLLDVTAIDAERRNDAGSQLWDHFLTLPLYRIEVGADPLAAAALLEQLL